jgi:hypothetical protein
MQDTSTVIERSERRSRPAGQLQLAQIIVLDDPGVAPPSPSEQRKPAGQRHRHPERRMLPWRDDRQRCVLCAPEAGSDIQAFGVDRNGRYGDAGQVERFACDRETRILDQGSRSLDLQSAHRQTERPGIACRDEHLGGTAPKTPCDPDIGRDLLSQLRIAPGIGIADRRGRRPPRRSREDARPQLERKGVL